MIKSKEHEVGPTVGVMCWFMNEETAVGVKVPHEVPKFDLHF